MPDTTPNLKLVEIRLPQTNEYTAEQMSSLLANFVQLAKSSLWDGLLNRHTTIASLELVLINGQIHFFTAIPEANFQFIKSQILAQYPTAIAVDSPDYLEKLDPQSLRYGQIGLSKSYYYPIKSTKDFKETEPLTSLLAPLSRSQPSDFFLYQIILSNPPKNWQGSIISVIQNGIMVDKEKNFRQPHPDKAVFEQKIQFPGILAQINFLSNNPGLIASVGSSFGIYTNPRGNFFKMYQPGLFAGNKLQRSVHQRLLNGLHYDIFNIEELSALWHFPTKLTKLPNIAWGKKLYADPPDNLPIADGLNDDQKKQVTFFAKTEFRNREVIFGIKEGEDRRRHTYIIGKSGTGKTTLIANMAIDDIRKGKGVAIIDPHGDLCNTILDYIPSSRINDCCYFNPADPDYVYPLNVLEATNDSQRELVASGVISIFKKLYGQVSWGPRLEHILRNAVLTLVNTPDSNMVHIIEILTNKHFREKIVANLQNQTLKNFWLNEYERMDAKFQNEAIAPILNKVGQFIASTNIRNTVAHAKSKVNIQSIMDQKKILIADLSTGKLGEDNSALLGAMLITQIQLSAMNRIYQAQSDRSDFYLYVDEFQNFATEAFIKILSEARKFKLNLIVANQYMAQLDRTIQDAILGNVGSIMSFVVGSSDAFILQKEFGVNFPAEDLVKIGRYQIICKLSIDSDTTTPFYATTLPPLNCKNQHRDTVIRVSQERWGKRKYPNPQSPPHATPPVPAPPSASSAPASTRQTDILQ
ncbi:type IV secretion system DNA-binding domain-containing protein [Patescibacteria group bacterium]|nr:type IV secretion system DNA-binding domain-containing protein [Patescibacteria group bacterium]